MYLHPPDTSAEKPSLLSAPSHLINLLGETPYLIQCDGKINSHAGFREIPYRFLDTLRD
jgi:hypothetical protein